MDSFNVLRGREPVRKGLKGNSDVYFCSGYIKYLPSRGAIYGIEFSGKEYTGSVSGKNPASKFNYYIFCSEYAYLKYLNEIADTDKNVTYKDLRGNTVTDSDANKFLTAKVSNKTFASVSELNKAIDNVASFVVSSGAYNKDPEIAYPRNIGFQGADYQHDPRPYSNLDGFVDSNNVQYPLYLVVVFNGTPQIDELDYQLIIQS